MSRPRLVLAALAAAVLLAAGIAVAADRPLVVDLSRPDVRINSAFRGTDITLFGAMDGPGDIVVVVVGPPQERIVLRKDRVLGLWLTVSRQEFANVPGYYAVAASAPLTRLLARGEVATETILIDQRLREIRPVHLGSRSPADLDAFREGLRAAQTRRGLYPDALAQVTIQGERLFRVDLHFPSTLPIGTYEVRTYQVSEGRITSTVTRPLSVAKSGFSARISEFARTEGPLYGALAIAAALFLGWIGAVTARRS